MIVRAQVLRVTRELNSLSGNPAYTFHTDKGKFRTLTDSVVAFDVPGDEDAMLTDGVVTTIHLNRDGRVRDYYILDTPRPRP